jgi:hypothetical protein
MKRTVVFGLVFVFLAVVMMAAQGKPNFSGTWTLDPEKSQMGGAPGGAPPGGGARGVMGGGPMTITQTANELTVERTMGGNAMKTVYKLDGTESVNETARGKSTSVAKWDGTKLVITTKSEGRQGPVERTVTWSMEGENLVQESAMGQGGTSKMVYKKG